MAFNPRALFVLVPVMAGSGAANADPLSECIDAHEKAQSSVTQGRLLEAERLFLGCITNDGCAPEVRTSCRELLADVVRDLPTVALRFADGAGSDRQDARFRIDGAESEARAGLAVKIDPGPHRIAATTQDGEAAEVRVVVPAGVKNFRVDLHAPQRAMPDPAGASRQGTTRPVPISVWVVGGIGLAGLTAGAVLGGMALNLGADLEDRCPCTPAELGNDYDTMRAMGIGADVALATGGAAVVTAFILYLVRPEAPDHSWSARPLSIRF